jgi:hypothetical protein
MIGARSTLPAAGDVKPQGALERGAEGMGLIEGFRDSREHGLDARQQLGARVSEHHASRCAVQQSDP